VRRITRIRAVVQVVEVELPLPLPLHEIDPRCRGL